MKQQDNKKVEDINEQEIRRRMLEKRKKDEKIFSLEYKVKEIEKIRRRRMQKTEEKERKSGREKRNKIGEEGVKRK